MGARQGVRRKVHDEELQTRYTRMSREMRSTQKKKT